MRYFECLLKELSDLMPLMKLFICSVFVMLLCSIPAYGTEYYVSPTGNDSNSGALASPWKTIAKANEKLRAGDTIYLRSGVYNEMIAPVNSGRPGLYISYKSFPNENPVIDRSQVLTDWHRLNGSIYWTEIPPWSSGVWEDNYEIAGYYCSYWPQTKLLEVNGPGKYFRDASALRVYIWTKSGDDPNTHLMRTALGCGAGFSSKSYILVDGIRMQWVQRGFKLSDCSYCIFTNLNIRYAAGYGIFLSGHSYHNKITNNVIFHIGSWYWDEGDG
ncbi:MAG: DUF1565 domain-containing protein, partial [Clostridiales bacterium]|nr:DUF1565 domain-containing protein [Clostridiales bacterium]